MRVMRGRGAAHLGEPPRVSQMWDRSQHILVRRAREVAALAAGSVHTLREYRAYPHTLVMSSGHIHTHSMRVPDISTHALDEYGTLRRHGSTYTSLGPGTC
eukprot:2117997-Rhodomonas_salina.4